jgi:GMP synthase-like glutamine amidotransferase
VHYLQHVPFEDAANIAVWAEARGHALSRTRFWLNEPLPDLGKFEMLVVMGGPMNVHEELQHPWLAREKEFLRQAVDAGKVIVGVCLGAQLLAVALGGEVTRNAHSEIGWFPVETTKGAAADPVCRVLPSSFTAFHWHGDTFSIPPGAVHIARSQGCANQAFIFGTKVLALQFHLETSARSLDTLVENCGDDDIVPGRYVQTVEELTGSPERIVLIGQIMEALLDQLVKENRLK